MPYPLTYSIIMSSKLRITKNIDHYTYDMKLEITHPTLGDTGLDTTNCNFSSQIISLQNLATHRKMMRAKHGNASNPRKLINL